VTAGDGAVVAAARDAGLFDDASPAAAAATIDSLYSAPSGSAAMALLRRRATVLGQAAASVRDMVAPDRVVLVGQAFTGCPAVREDITSAFTAATTSGDVPVSFTRFGAGIQAITACTIALGPVYDDPLGLVPRRPPAGDSALADAALAE
jgi:hypothetical protein